MRSSHTSYTILLKFRDPNNIMNVRCSNELATYSISGDPFHRNYNRTMPRRITEMNEWNGEKKTTHTHTHAYNNNSQMDFALHVKFTVHCNISCASFEIECHASTHTKLMCLHFAQSEFKAAFTFDCNMQCQMCMSTGWMATKERIQWLKTCFGSKGLRISQHGI